MTTSRPLARIRFFFERLVLRGLRYRLMLAGAIIVTVAVLAGSLITLVDTGSTSLGDDLWWAFLRLTDPGYLGDDEGFARRFVSTVVTVLGYVLFLGLLIAILTQWMNDSIAKLESGVTPVALADHVIILGWSHSAPTIVSELLRTRGRLERFLSRHEARELRVVILAERVDRNLSRELRERLGEDWSERRVLLRSGSPLRLDHLERVAFRNAAVLILPGAGFAERRPETVDAQTVKTLMAVSKHARESGAAPPLAVAELFDGRRALVAREGYAGDSEILATDDIVSRILCESVRQPGVCSVFTELLTLGMGCALYVRHVEGLAGRAFGEIRGSCSRAIAIGAVRPGAGSAVLDPDPETRLEEGDEVVFVARSFDECAPGEGSWKGERASTSAPAHAPRETRRVLILGWSRKVPAVLENFARYGAHAFEIDVVSTTPLEERERALERRGAAEGHGPRVRQIVAAFTAPGVLQRLEPTGYDNIVILASERLDAEDEADATTIFAYLILRGLLPREGARPGILVELLEEENRALFEGEAADVVVSPLLVSYLLSQVALRRELADVFAELSRPEGAQVVLEPARSYLETRGPVTFGEVERIAARRGEIALGLRCPGDGGLALAPDRDAGWTPAANDELVLLRRP
ncbi:MAG: hypothetical protein QNK04_25150 [Myxococcota bacterium]|nr:hypothetical protein [Myxococcota bacterium]